MKGHGLRCAEASPPPCHHHAMADALPQRKKAKKWKRGRKDLNTNLMEARRPCMPPCLHGAVSAVVSAGRQGWPLLRGAGWDAAWSHKRGLQLTKCPDRARPTRPPCPAPLRCQVVGQLKPHNLQGLLLGTAVWLACDGTAVYLLDTLCLGNLDGGEGTAQGVAQQLAATGAALAEDASKVWATQCSMCTACCSVCLRCELRKTFEHMGASVRQALWRAAAHAFHCAPRL